MLLTRTSPIKGQDDEKIFNWGCGRSHTGDYGERIPQVNESSNIPR